MNGITAANALQRVLVDSAGHLQVDVLSGGGSNDSVVTDDAAVTLGSQKGTMIAGFAGTQSVDANDAALLSCTTSGELKVACGTAATSLGKAIQSAQGTTDTGVAALVVRNDTLADLSGADGDYTPLQVNVSGALYTTGKAGTTGTISSNNNLTAETTFTSSEIDLSKKDSKLTIWGSVNGITGASAGYNAIKITGAVSSGGTFAEMGDNHELLFDADGKIGHTINIEAPYIKFTLNNQNASARTLTLYYSWKDVN